MQISNFLPDIQMQMDAILELETQWNSIKTDPKNLYHLAPNPNGNMLAHLNLNTQPAQPAEN